jgi:hypothetical protein
MHVHNYKLKHMTILSFSSVNFGQNGFIESRPNSRPNSAPKADMPRYEMAPYTRGLALIVEIDRYDENVHKPRIGSHVSERTFEPSFVRMYIRL